MHWATCPAFATAAFVASYIAALMAVYIALFKAINYACLAYTVKALRPTVVTAVSQLSEKDTEIAIHMDV